MRVWGPLCILLGIIGLIVAFVTDTAPQGTHNLGLLQRQMIGLQFGLGMLIVGAVLAGASAIVDQLERSAEPAMYSQERPDVPASALSDAAHHKRIIGTAAAFVVVVLILVFLLN